MNEGALAFHLATGAFWGAVAVASAWKDGKASALRIGAAIAIVMASFSAGCDSLRTKTDDDCRPAGPAIYNDC